MWTEFLFIIVSIIIHLVMIGIFFSRRYKNKKIENILGYVFLITAFPIVIVMIQFIRDRYPIWILIYLGILLVFYIAELILDYLWKIPFRSNLKILIPYLLLYYVACMGLVAINFTLNISVGIVNLILYFTQMIIGIIQERRKRA